MGGGINLYHVVVWLHLLCALAGIMVCGINRRVSPWVWVIVGGIAAQAATPFFCYLVPFILRDIIPMGESESVCYDLATFTGPVGSAASVVGLAGVLFDVRRRLETQEMIIQALQEDVAKKSQS